MFFLVLFFFKQSRKNVSVWPKGVVTEGTGGKWRSQQICFSVFFSCAGLCTTEGYGDYVTVYFFFSFIVFIVFSQQVTKR